MELFPCTPNMVGDAPVRKKGLIKVGPCFDAMGAENKVTRRNKPGKKLEKPFTELSGSSDERFVEPPRHDGLKSQGLSDGFRDFKHHLHLRVHHRNLLASSAGTNPVVTFTPDFKIHDDLDPGFHNRDLAEEFISISKGDDVFGGSFNDGKQNTCFFKIILKINAAFIQESEPGHIKIFHQISMPNNIHGIQIVEGDPYFHLAVFSVFHTLPGNGDLSFFPTSIVGTCFNLFCTTIPCQEFIDGIRVYCYNRREIKSV